MVRSYIKIASVIAAITMISVPLAYIYTSTSNTSNPDSISFGPRIIISYPGNITGTNNTTVQVQVFSVVPRSVGMSSRHVSLSGLNVSNNSYYVQLLNITLANNTTATFLSPVFNTIVLDWSRIFSGYSGTTMPALTIEATKTVISSNKTYLYDYYNNIPYNPESIKMVTLNGSYINSTSYRGWFNNTEVPTGSYSYSVLNFPNLSFNQSLMFPDIASDIFNNTIYNLGDGRSNGNSILPDSSDIYYTYPVDTVDQGVTTTSINGVLPFIAIHMGRGTANGASIVHLGAAVTVINDTLGINSAQIGISASGAITSQMSTNPSYEHVASLYTGTSVNEYPVYPLNLFSSSANSSVRQNQTTGYVGIQNVTYTFTHFNQYTNSYKNEYQKTCVIYEYIDGQPIYKCSTELLSSTLLSSVYDGNFTVGSITNINTTNGIQLQSGFLPIEVNMVLQKLLEGSSNGTLVLNDSGSGTTLQASTVWAHTYAYTNGAQAIQDASNALKTFSTAIDLGLAVSDVLSAADVFDTTLPEIVSDSLELISQTLDMSASVLNLFSTISFVSGTKAVSIGYGVTNAPAPTGSSYNMQLFESASPLSFIANGNSYQIYAPTDYLNATSIIT
jgi:hypothetical protein